MSSLEKIENELKKLGYNPFYMDNTPQGRAIVINYKIPTGKYEGEKVLMGFSFQEDGYPEYPPHWIHISPAYNDDLGGTVQSYSHSDNQGIERQWLALSRTPQDFWDTLPEKTIKHYLYLHIYRFCKDLK